MVNEFLQGELLFVDFEPHVGREPSKYRADVVVSSDELDRRSSICMAVPVTSTDNGHPFHVPIDCGGVFGWACVEQKKGLDLRARRCRKVGGLSFFEMDEILTRVGAIFDI